MNRYVKVIFGSTSGADKNINYNVEAINKKFDTYNNAYFSEYKNKIDFSLLQNLDSNCEEIIIFLKEIFINSFENALKKENVYLIRELHLLIKYLENYFRIGIEKNYFKNNQEFYENIVYRMRKRLKCIDYLPPNLSGVYGYQSDGVIYIRDPKNPYPEYSSLTQYEVRMMNLYHELGHCFLEIKEYSYIKTLISNTDELFSSSQTKISNEKTKKYIINGLTLLEECLTQEMAEEIIFSIARERCSSVKRPSIEYQTDIIPCFNNLFYYGIFQEPTVYFGRMFNNSTNDDCYTVLKKMTQKALNENFITFLTKRFSEKNENAILMIILYNLGLIATKKYSSFGSFLNTKYVGNNSEIEIIPKKDIINISVDDLNEALYSILKYTGNLSKPLLDYNDFSRDSDYTKYLEIHYDRFCEYFQANQKK